jgi:hypothetical protein
MNWIKENKFLAMLCGGTLLGVILLLFIGSRGSGRYSTALEEFQTAADEAAGYEKGPLYPKEVNRAAKNKALDDYRQELEGLQSAHQPFRPEEITNVSPQEFTDRLIAVNEETRKAFEDNGVTVPDPYFVGFERYKTTLASKESTGILGYELAGIRNLMLSLAAAKPKELRNLYRGEIPEESGKTYEPGDAVARSFPLEITFTGPEKSVRDFATAVTKLDEKYAVIRVLRISNEKKDPPRSADAQFEKPAETPDAGAGDMFSGDFVLPGEEPAAADPEAAVEEVAVPDAAATESGRILSQVLGDEDVQVFLRIDLLQFLPAKKLR